MIPGFKAVCYELFQLIRKSEVEEIILRIKKAKSLLFLLKQHESRCVKFSFSIRLKCGKTWRNVEKCGEMWRNLGNLGKRGETLGK